MKLVTLKSPTENKNANHFTDRYILENAVQLDSSGSTVVTSIVIDGKDLLVANNGDSRALCERGSANQLTVDHEPHVERRRIEKQGGFVTNLSGDEKPRGDRDGEIHQRPPSGGQAFENRRKSKDDISCILMILNDIQPPNSLSKFGI